MGEAKRRAEVTSRVLHIPRDSAALADCAARALHDVAEYMQTGIFLKEEGDDLADFPIGALVGGGFPNAEAVRSACPLIMDIRHVPEFESWQFQIPDRLFLGLYFADIMIRGLPPVSPVTFMEAVRRYLVHPDGGWTVVGPVAAAAKPSGRAN